jgi:serine phosphatase RsbU (regulator of sigma subunit)
VLLLADVAGKGMPASLLTASLEALAAGPIEEGLPPEEVFSRVSRRLHERTTPERYATAFLATLKPSTGRLRWASAGHNPGLLLRAGGELEQLGATGLPLGLLPLGAYTGEDRILDPGDLLVVYTDGITEAANPDGEEYGVERLVELCRRESERALAALVAKLVQELDAFVAGMPYGDDRTFLMLRRLPG